jgi:hypothetical protein
VPVYVRVAGNQVGVDGMNLQASTFADRDG